MGHDSLGIKAFIILERIFVSAIILAILVSELEVHFIMPPVI